MIQRTEGRYQDEREEQCPDGAGSPQIAWGGGKPPRFYESLRGSKLAQNRGLGAEYIGQSWSLADEEKTRESSC